MHELDVLFPPRWRASAAVVVEAGARRWTGQALWDAASRLAAWLPAGPVAVLSADPASTLPVLLGALAAGVPYAPLDPAWPPARLAAVAGVLRPAALLVDPAIPADDPRVAAVGVAPISLDSLEDLSERAGPAPAGGGPATVFFTSGSTGQPKGILGRPGAIAHFIAWEQALLGAGPGLRVSALAPPTFDASLRDALLPLSVGGTVCVPPDRGALADPARLAAWLAEARVEVVHTVPTVFRGLLALPDLDLPALRAVLLAGEALRPADAARFLARFGEGVALYNLYGPTETTMIKLCHRVTPADAEAESVPLGRPLPGATVQVLDPAGRPRPPGRPGEIVITTPHCALGYLGDADAGAFGVDADGTPTYRTGDLGVLRADGVLEFRGRRDHQVKLRGVRVELEEVEAALAGAPGVVEAAAGLRDAVDGEPRLVAWIVGSVSPGLWAHLEATLPAALWPARLVTLASLPRLLNGKIDRAALALPAVADALDATPPEGPLEARITLILQEILGTPVGARADFFRLGGDSLQALRAVWRLNEAFGVELPIDTLYQHRTVQALAPLLAAAAPVAGLAPTDAPTLTLTTLRRGEGAPALWLPPSYGFSLVYRDLAGRLPRRSLALDLRTGPTTMAALGAAAADRLREHGPPWTLIGWSFGGALAFEVARRLAPDGAGVDLVLLDSAAPGDPYDFASADPQLAALAIDRLGGLLGRPLTADAALFAGLTPDAMMAKVLDIAEENGVPVSPATRREAAAVMGTRAATMDAWRTWRPAPWPGRALVVRAADAEADWTAGWDAVITGGVERVTLAGDHRGLLAEPAASALVALLTARRAPQAT
ncbi:MAG: AMP-binding protein [Myxococcales bacterium]|nr:AMP-binding protein [Myxococcales bacterium]